MATKKKAPRKRAKKQPVQQQPEPVSVLITGSYPNPMWLKGVDKSGKLYKISAPKRFSNKLLHKQITVHPIDGQPEEYYKYEP